MCTATESSTLFTGLGAGEKVIELVRERFQHRGIKVSLNSCSACEKNAKCRTILSQRVLSSRSCLFGDVLELLDLSATGYRKDSSFEQKMVIFSTVQVRTHAWCSMHNRMCPVKLGQIDGPTGPPCTPFSKIGLCKGIEDDVIDTWLAMGRLYSHFDVPLGLLENVPQCPDDLCTRIFPKHQLVKFAVSPSDCGFGLIRRDRVYYLLVSKAKAVITHDVQSLYQQISDKLRNVMTSPSDALLASTAEIRVEEARVCAQRGMKIMAYNDINFLGYLLSTEQRAYVQEYLRLMKVKGLGPVRADTCFDIGDDPRAKHGREGWISWSCGHGSIPCFRRNSHVVYFPLCGRWLTNREKLAAMGWPTYPLLLNNFHRSFYAEYYGAFFGYTRILF